MPLTIIGAGGRTKKRRVFIVVVVALVVTVVIRYMPFRRPGLILRRRTEGLCGGRKHREDGRVHAIPWYLCVGRFIKMDVRRTSIGGFKGSCVWIGGRCVTRNIGIAWGDVLGGLVWGWLGQLVRCLRRHRDMAKRVKDLLRRWGDIEGCKDMRLVTLK